MWCWTEALPAAFLDIRNLGVTAVELGYVQAVHQHVEDDFIITFREKGGECESMSI